MSTFEILTLIVSLLALLVALISLNRSSNFNQKILTQQNSSSVLAEKQLSNLEEEELLGKQPTFAIQTIGISGMGDSNSPEYRVKVKFKLIHSGQNYLNLDYVAVIALRDNLFKLGVVAGVYLDYGEQLPVLGDHTVYVKPESQLFDCRIHIVYSDVEGVGMIQEFGIFPEGPPGLIPMTVRFERQKIYKVKPNLAALWLKPTQ